MSYAIRCWASSCPRKDTCERYTLRKVSSPSTGHHDKLCHSSAFVAYVKVKQP